MMILNSISSFTAIRIAILLSVLAPSIIAQTANSRAIPASEILRMIEAQPAHIAEMNLYHNSVTPERWRIVQKKNRIRKEFHNWDKGKLQNGDYIEYRVVTIAEQGQPLSNVDISAENLLPSMNSKGRASSLAFDRQTRTYAEMPAGEEYAILSVYNVLKGVTSNPKELTIEEAGEVVIDGHSARKIKLKFERVFGGKFQEQGEVFLYFARDLENLLIRFELGIVRPDIWAQSGVPYKKHFAYMLSDISLHVTDDMFELPPGYKKVEYDVFFANLR